MRQLIIGVTTLVTLITGGVTIAQTSGSVVNKTPESELPKFPEVYPDNSNLTSDKIKKEDEIKSKIKVNSGKLEKLQLYKLGDVEKEFQLPRTNSTSPNRLVYLVRMDFPSGLETSRAKYKKAKGYAIIDAETGQYFADIIKSDPKDTDYKLPKKIN